MTLSINEVDIVSLDWQATLGIRQAVLWPEKPRSFCRVEGDEQARHYGLHYQGLLIGVASLYWDTEKGNTRSVRLRKLAILEKFQGQGLGHYLLTHMIRDISNQGADRLWCDARESAKPFYQRLGFDCDSERFYKSGVPYFLMGIRLKT